MIFAPLVIEVGGPADAGDAAVHDEDRVGIENWLGKIARQDKPDVADQEPAGAGGSGSGRGVGHGAGCSFAWRIASHRAGRRRRRYRRGSGGGRGGTL